MPTERALVFVFLCRVDIFGSSDTPPFCRNAPVGKKSQAGLMVKPGLRVAIFQTSFYVSDLFVTKLSTGLAELAELVAGKLLAELTELLAESA